MKPLFTHPLGNLLPNVYTESLENEDISLKALPSIYCNNSKKINKAAFAPGLICSQRQGAT